MAHTHTFIVDGISDELKDKAVFERKALFNKHKGTYHISYDDLVKVAKPPYNLLKRKDNNMWQMEWYVNRKKTKRSTGLKDYSLAREKAKEIWQEYSAKLYALIID